MDAQLLGQRERRKVEKEEAVSHLPASRKEKKIFILFFSLDSISNATAYVGSIA
jgi:hypothetical protein